MLDVKAIESAVARLSADDSAAFRAWFAEFDAEQWDVQFEQDASSGRLDALANEAIEDRDVFLRRRHNRVRLQLRHVSAPPGHWPFAG